MTKIGRPITSAAVLCVAAVLFTGCAANSGQLESEHAYDDEAPIGAAQQNATSTSCTPITSVDSAPNAIQNSGVCTTTSQTIRDAINRPLVTIVTTRTCNSLTDEEQRIYCEEDSACHLSRVVAMRVTVYPYDGCPSGDSGEGGDEPSYDPEGDNHGDNYNRTDGCGFDQYGRWVCR